jgi:hypothetical protein
LRRFPWGSFLLTLAILVALATASYWGWFWIEPLLSTPADPHYDPAILFGQDANPADFGDDVDQNPKHWGLSR